MAEKIPGGRRGLLESLTTLAATLVAIAYTRLDLLSADMEEEREHLFSLQVWTLTSLFLFGVGVVLTAILLAAIFWDTYRFVVLCGLAGFFLAAGIAAWLFVIQKVRTKPKAFAASLSELLKDSQHLDSGL